MSSTLSDTEELQASTVNLPLPLTLDGPDLDRLVTNLHRDLEDETRCWTYASGYRRPRIEIKGQRYLVARLVQALWTGTDPGEDTVEHLCSRGLMGCVNPYHQTTLSVVDNVMAPTSNGMGARHARQTHCIHGHQNWRTSVDAKGRTHRTCRTCDNLRHAQR